MKGIVRIIALILVDIACSSCLTLSIIGGIYRAKEERRATGADFGFYEADLRVKTIQRVSEHAALGVTGGGDVVCIVTYLGEYYDGKIITNEYVREGTYSYYSASGAAREVLLYIDKDNYTLFKSYADKELR